MFQRNLSFAFSLYLSCLLAGSHAVAASQTDDSDALITFNVAADPDYANAATVLKKYAAKKRPHRKNSFCLLGLTQKSDRPQSRIIYVFWPEKNQMFLWGGEDLNEFSPSKVWDLKRDVVKKETAASRTSTYIFLQSRIDQFKQACAKDGLHLVFPK